MREGWQAYLKERYGSDQAISDAWDGAFSSEEAWKRELIKFRKTVLPQTIPDYTIINCIGQQVAR